MVEKFSNEINIFKKNRNVENEKFNESHKKQ
jgi:hypothetical protein